MTLPVASNAISMAQVNTELGKAANAPISLNDAAVRSLFGKPSGAISLSDGWGKSSETVVNYTLTSASWHFLEFHPDYGDIQFSEYGYQNGAGAFGHVGGSLSSYTFRGYLIEYIYTETNQEEGVANATMYIRMSSSGGPPPIDLWKKLIIGSNVYLSAEMTSGVGSLSRLWSVKGGPWGESLAPAGAHAISLVY